MTRRADSICGDGRRSWKWSLGVIAEIGKTTRLIVGENKRMGILVWHTEDGERQRVEERRGQEYKASVKRDCLKQTSNKTWMSYGKGSQGRRSQ